MDCRSNEETIPYLIDISGYDDLPYDETTRESATGESTNNHLDATTYSKVEFFSQGLQYYDTNSWVSSAHSTANDYPNSLASCSSSSSNEERYSHKKIDKNLLECSLCANHNEWVLLKGHKHYCRFVSCTCELCLISKNEQLYTKMQHKQSRHRLDEAPYHQEYHQFGASALEEPVKDEPPRKVNWEFPKALQQEMLRDLSLLDDSYLDKINVLCKTRKKN